jgi:cytoskeletal protein RodZ
MKTRTVGQLLADTRMRASVTLDQLSEASAVPREYLEALERDAFEELPPIGYVQGYVRWYAQLLDFDPEPVFAMLRRDYPQPSADRTSVKNARATRLAMRRLPVVQWGVLALGCFFFVLFSYVGYQWYLSQQPPMLTITAPAEQETVAASVKVTGQTVFDGTVRVNSAPVALFPDGSFETEVVLPREGLNTITIEVRDARGKQNTQQRTVFVRL